MDETIGNCVPYEKVVRLAEKHELEIVEYGEEIVGENIIVLSDDSGGRFVFVLDGATAGKFIYKLCWSDVSQEKPSH